MPDTASLNLIASLRGCGLDTQSEKGEIKIWFGSASHQNLGSLSSARMKHCGSLGGLRSGGNGLGALGVGASGLSLVAPLLSWLGDLTLGKGRR